VIAALVHETTVGQAAGMHMAYTRYLATIEPEEEEEADEAGDSEEPAGPGT
jgi:hypothetical protein